MLVRQQRGYGPGCCGLVSPQVKEVSGERSIQISAVLGYLWSCFSEGALQPWHDFGPKTLLAHPESILHSWVLQTVPSKD